MIHQVQAARYWDQGEDDRDFKYNNYLSRYHSRHLDLMALLSLYNGRANAPLDELSKLCGFPGKLGMDGSQVWPAWREGRIDEIRAYCETDVANTYLVFLRFQRLRGALDEAQYQKEGDLVRTTLAQTGEAHSQSGEARSQSGEARSQSGEARSHWAEYLAAWGAH